MKNRWLIAAAAVGIHISIGSVYAWSVVSKPMTAEFGWTLDQVTCTFKIAIAFLGLAAAFLGGWVGRVGPKKAGLLSTFMFCGGLVLAGLACQIKSLWLLYIGYGVIGGMGIGIGYLTPVPTLLRWFPDKRGLATGMAIMGFGFAAMVSRPLMQPIIDSAGIAAVFYALAGIYFVLMFSASQYLSLPPEGWTPPACQAASVAGKPAAYLPMDMTLGQAVRTKRFYLLWLMFFINITCGIAVISVASPLGQEMVQMTPTAAATMVGMLGVFNGLGRIGWSSLSDKIGRSTLWMLFFVLQSAAFFTLPHVQNLLLFQAIIFLIVSCYGGGFASMPAFLSDLFGTRQVSAILGYILTAWSLAGIVGPTLIARMRQSSGSYGGVFGVFGGLFVAALVVSVLLWADSRKLRFACADKTAA